ncbi:MAG TPA: helix-turn-helix transcriptional regulator [Rhizomicrobium sp.]|jgi:transcriptional regulator with XRE-family HTH domain|nr:helix-turn-helix transcriptional regulator [Rhizomicrobium sp.]
MTMTSGTSYAKTDEGLIRVVLPAMVLTFAMATGGDLVRYVRLCDAQFSDGVVHTQTQETDNIIVATAAQELARIKSVMKLSTTDLARVLGVSRQAIYNWKAGSHIKADNLSRLSNLKAAADAFVQARVTVSPRVLERKLSGGNALLDIISTGGNGTAAANELIGMLSLESDQRRALDAILAENISRPSTPFDYGAPAFHED